jgi:hypothetical protein
MEDLRKEQKRLAHKVNYNKAIDKVQEAIDLLLSARNAVERDPSIAAIQLAKLKQATKKSFDGANDNLKEVNSGLKGYAKVLDKVIPIYSLTSFSVLIVILDI